MVFDLANFGFWSVTWVVHDYHVSFRMYIIYLGGIGGGLIDFGGSEGGGDLLED